MSPEPGLPATGAPDANGAGPPEAPARELLDQPFDRDSLVALRSAVAAHASRLGLPDDQVEHVVLVAYELASNAVRHGAGHGRLRLAAGDGVIGCTVTDRAAGSADAGTAGSDPAGADRERRPRPVAGAVPGGHGRDPVGRKAAPRSTPGSPSADPAPGPYAGAPEGIVGTAPLRREDLSCSIRTSCTS